MDNQYISAIELLPDYIYRILYNLQYKINAQVSEIRIRSQKPLCLTTGIGMVYPNLSGYSLLPSKDSIIISEAGVQECFIKLCNQSVYHHEQELSHGYLTLKNGHRAGICGRMIIKDNGIPWLTDVSSINIRVAHEIKGVSSVIYGAVREADGLLICGPPHSGKTTMLRDYIRIASECGERVAVVDCRGEIAAVKNGVCGLDVGTNTDVITGGEKAKGIEQALRTLNPDIIAFDEIGSNKELMKIADCMNCGVRVVATLHCKNKNQLILRNKYLPILETGAFSHFVFLDSSFNSTVYKESELYREAFRDTVGDDILHNCRNDLCYKAL